MSERDTNDRTGFQPLANPTRRFSGRVFRYGDDVNTDVIFPGKYTYTLSTPQEVAPHALEDLDPTFTSRVETGDVIVAGRNFGCGSSREQAATCLRAVGIGAVIALSFGRIFYRNALNHGLLALVVPEAVDALEDGDRVTIDLSNRTLERVEEPQRGFSLPPFSASTLAMLESGGLIEATRKRLQERSR
jgi:3-isopropylmalate/(R)-2-methylmalate dehydratase small subunit